MKTAKIYVAVIEFTCPYCGEHLSSQTGSHHFLAKEELPPKLVCDCCGKTSSVPKKAHKLGEL